MEKGKGEGVFLPWTGKLRNSGLMSAFNVHLTLAGWDGTRHFGFTRLIASARSRQGAEKEYQKFLDGHHFKRSELYGVFLSIKSDGRTIFQQQIN